LERNEINNKQSYYVQKNMIIDNRMQWNGMKWNENKIKNVFPNIVIFKSLFFVKNNLKFSLFAIYIILSLLNIHFDFFLRMLQIYLLIFSLTNSQFKEMIIMNSDKLLMKKEDKIFNWILKLMEIYSNKKSLLKMIKFILVLQNKWK
jgi:hypothetical protein